MFIGDRWRQSPVTKGELHQLMISVQLNLDQKLNQVHAELHCTMLNSDQLIPFSWTAVVIPWTTLIGQAQWRHLMFTYKYNNLQTNFCFISLYTAIRF